MNITKRRSHKAALLDLLSDGKLHPMAELLEVGGYRYGGRLHELRQQGHVIETIYLAPDQYAYRLVPVGQMHLL